MLIKIPHILFTYRVTIGMSERRLPSVLPNSYDVIAELVEDEGFLKNLKGLDI
jgi:hypothetical protein